MTHSCKGVCKTSHFDSYKLKQSDKLTKDSKIKKCSECDNIKFFNFDGWNCPCCGNGLRTRKTYCRLKRLAKEQRQSISSIQSPSMVETKTITVNGMELQIVIV